MKENSYLKILKNKNFLRVWLAQLFSLVSATTLNFVLIGRVYALSHSAVAVGFYIFFYYFPTALLGLFVGVLIDNWNKKSIFIYSNLIQAIMVLFYLGIREKLWPIYLIVFLYSLGDEFYNPAVGASLPAIVEKKYLPAANSLFFLTTQGSIIAGAFAGGIMLKLLRNTNHIFIFVSFLLFMTALLALSLPDKPFKGTKKLKIDFSDPLDISRTFDLPSFWKQTKEGYFFITRETRVLFPILLLTGLASIVAMGVVLLPAMADMLKIVYADTSFHIIIPVTLGAVIGGWLIEKIVKKVRKNTLILGGLASMGTSILFLSFITLFPRRLFIFTLPLILTLGISYVFIYVPLQTLLQEHTPFKVRGRVFGALSTLVTLAAAFPMLVATTLIDLFGIRLVLIALGAGLIFLSAFAHRRKEIILTINSEK